MSTQSVRARIPGSGSGYHRILWVSAIALLAFCAPSAVAENLLHARVSFDSGGAMIRGTADADWSYATVNTLVLPGDTLWVDKKGTLEVEMSGGTFLRMADGSKAEVVALPPSMLVKGWVGAFYVQRISRSTGEVTFETPVCKVSVQRDSHVRVDVISSGATTVTVRWGRATVWAEGGESTVLAIGQRCYCDPGYLPSEPRPFNRNDEDAFDEWNRERARLLATGSDNVPDPVIVKSEPIGFADLNSYGEWIYEDSVHYWRPTFVVDYIPYRAGHWSFVPGCGYVWVGDYPFCYVTSHYGRWRHHPRYGWLWTYRDTWGPAWVASVRYGPNFVWCPLDPWGYPVVTTTDYFYVGGLRFGVYASTYCPVDSLFMGPCFVNPCVPSIFYNVPRNEINIWNIYIGGYDHHHRIPYRDNNIRVRDYSPRRVIRGFDGSELGKATSRARVAALEVFEGGRSYSAPGRPSSIRTTAGNEGRTAQMRTVRLDAAGASETPAVPRRTRQEQLEVNGSDRGRGGIRRADTTTDIPKTPDGLTTTENRVPTARTRATARSGDDGQTQVGGIQTPGRTRTVREAPVMTHVPETTTHGEAITEAPDTTARTSVPRERTIAPDADSRITRIGGETRSRTESTNTSIDEPARTRTVRDAETYAPTARTQAPSEFVAPRREISRESTRATQIDVPQRAETRVQSLDIPSSRPEVSPSEPIRTESIRTAPVRSAPMISAPTPQIEPRSESPRSISVPSAPSPQIESRSAPSISTPSRSMSSDHGSSHSVSHGDGGGSRSSSHRGR